MSKDKDTKVVWICPACGSNDVVIDAWAVWDVSTQSMVLGNTFDHMMCQDCGDELDYQGAQEILLSDYQRYEDYRDWKIEKEEAPLNYDDWVEEEDP